MKAKHLVYAVLALFLFTSCSTLMNMMPEVPMEKRQVIYDKAESMAFPEARELGRSKDRRMDLKAGQWISVLNETTEGDKNVTLTTTKVISVSGTTVVLEMETFSAADDALPTYSQITLANYPVKGKLSYPKEEFDAMMANLRITRSINRQGDGPVNETPPELLAMMQGMSRNLMAGSMVRLDEPERTEYESRYIRTSSCFSHNYTVSIMGMTTHGRSLTHSSVPVSGAIATENNHTKTLTVAYGYKGAKSVF
ncbi:hypothetical protein DSLASN_31160 [Desulfoluna limicola]|uniref:Lipoprotein n=1 Tax=Desulfoluna limicola TaxID=2810562 RepID=A0ABM7PJP3_9BACT|nr:hypothetical protein [Desulfoluna limicola]BCS97484.1 hypothetical protein DSLASN_31160 [Desulfoluna limicola]